MTEKKIVAPAGIVVIRNKNSLTDELCSYVRHP